MHPVREGNVIVRHIATGTTLLPTDAKLLVQMDLALYFRSHLYKLIAPKLVYPLYMPSMYPPVSGEELSKALNELNAALDIFFTRFSVDGNFVCGSLSAAGTEVFSIFCSFDSTI